MKNSKCNCGLVCDRDPARQDESNQSGDFCLTSDQSQKSNGLSNNFGPHIICVIET